MKTFVLLNQHAGSFEKASALIEMAAQNAHTSLYVCQSKDDVPSLVRRTIDDGYDTIVAGGGDGTIHEVVNAMIGQFDRIRLGLIPLGTGNDFCRSLGIPIDPTQALSMILENNTQERRVDLIQVEAGSKKEICVNLVSGGIGGEIEKHVDKSVKERWGALAYVRGALSAATNVIPFELELQIDQQDTKRLAALNITIANGRTAGGGFEVAPHASPDDRKMDVVLVHPGNPIELAAVATRLATGDYTKSDRVSEFRAREISIRSNPPMDFSVDGSLFAQSPILFKLMPGALRLLAPKLSQNFNKFGAVG